MIKFEHTTVMNFEAAIRGMRNPLNSWEKSDSLYCDDRANCDGCPLNGADPDHWIRNLCLCDEENPYIIGPKDMDLARRLIKAGSDHRKFLRQILVSVDIIAPLYWWKEFDTYKVGTVANSCSTMHKIHEKEFTRDDFSAEHIGSTEVGSWTFNMLLDAIITQLNRARELYLETHDKAYWWQMIQLLPASYNQRRTVTLNYEVLFNIYHSRAGHKLDEWRAFRDWIYELPYVDKLFEND